MELQFSQYQHQSTPVPRNDKVCSALRYRNIDPLGRRHEYTGGFSHEVSVSARDTWCMLIVHVSNAEVLQRSGLSTIGDILRHRRLSLFGYVPRMDPGVTAWCSASDGGYLRRQKAHLEKTGGSPSQRLAQQSLGGYQRSTTIYAVEIWDRQESRSGTTVTRTTRRRRSDDGEDDDDDDDDDEGWLMSRVEVKLIFQGTYRLSWTGIVECLKIIDVGCNLKQFDVVKTVRVVRGDQEPVLMYWPVSRLIDD